MIETMTRREAEADAYAAPWETVAEDGHTCGGCGLDTIECECREIEEFLAQACPRCHDAGCALCLL